MQERKTISESADKIVLTTKIKRGNDTRDQDEIKVKIKGNDPEEAAFKLHHTVLSIQAEGTPETLRDTQPTEDN